MVVRGGLLPGTFLVSDPERRKESVCKGIPQRVELVEQVGQAGFGESLARSLELLV